MSNWDSELKFEKQTTTNWSEELLGITRNDNEDSKKRVREDTVTDSAESSEKEDESWVIEREDILPGKDVFLLTPCFDLEECKKIISASETLGFGRTNYPKLYRGNCRLITTDLALAEALWGRMRALVPSHLEEDGCTWDAVGLNECFRLSKYVDGDVFGSHIDTFYQRNSQEKSMYTVNIYLNGDDEFQRGRTRFYNDQSLSPECSVTPAAGVGLIFRQPPSAHYSHDGEVVREGSKYLIRSDIMYRKRT